ncbi:MAG TPA: LysR substrate-binding domain-containing protein [Caulobacteraceae bacterium]|jgi:LysR family glycine cleavage system transcriptional activator|nr:LysR substrate-binding domain-containing protein [Caulobacteraceae bacterium]
MINRPWLPLNALRAFDAVAQHLSFTAAAESLRVSQSALSRHVIGLETLLGKKLLERRPQHLVLTEAGAVLLPVVRKSFDRLEQVLNSIREGEPSLRTLRIHIPPTLLNHVVLPMLQDFRREFPDIPIDVSSAHVTGVPATEFDAAIVYDRARVDDWITDLLWMVRVSPVCSPELAKANAGKPLARFIADNELLHVKLEGERRGLLWAGFLTQCDIAADTEKGLAFDTALSAVQYAMAGGGVALADVDMFAEEIAVGRLVAPYDVVLEEGYGYYLKFHSEDLGDPVVSLFRSWLISRFRGRISGDASEASKLASAD